MDDITINIKLSEVMERYHTAMVDIEDCPEEFDDFEMAATHILLTIFSEYSDDITQYAFRRMIEDDLNNSLN